MRFLTVVAVLFCAGCASTSYEGVTTPGAVFDAKQCAGLTQAECDDAVLAGRLAFKTANGARESVGRNLIEGTAFEKRAAELRNKK